MPVNQSIPDTVISVLQQTRDKRPTEAAIYGIDGDRADIRLDNSVAIIRHVQVVGDVDTINVGDIVQLSWRADGRPVVILTGSGGMTSVSHKSVVPDNVTIENSSVGLRVKRAGISREHLSFIIPDESSFLDSLLGAGWAVNQETGTLSHTGITISPVNGISLGSGNDIVRLSSYGAMDDPSSPEDDTEYRLWIGHTYPWAAPFAVSKDGSLRASKGTLGGWSLADNELYSDIGNAIIHAGARPFIGMGAAEYGDTGFWAGKDTDYIYKVSIGEVGGPLLAFDGSDLTLQDIDLKIYNGSDLTLWIQDDGDFAIGSDIDTVSGTSMRIFSNDQSYNSESFTGGDILIGDHDGAHMLWDESEGQLQFRDGATTGRPVQVYIDTDGALRAGGGNVTINSEGILIVEGDTSQHSIYWLSEAGNNVLGIWAWQTVMAENPDFNQATIKVYMEDDAEITYLSLLAGTTTSNINTTVTVTAYDYGTSGTAHQVFIGSSSEEYIVVSENDPTFGTGFQVKTGNMVFLQAKPTGVSEVIINPSGNDIDFRVEGTSVDILQTNAYDNVVRFKNWIEIVEHAAPTAGKPSSGWGAIYAGTDGKIYYKNDGGTTYDLTDTGGAGEWSESGGFLTQNSSSDIVQIQNWLELEELTTGNLPTTGEPGTGFGAVYVKTATGKIYFKNDSGTEYDLTATGGSGYWTQGSGVLYPTGDEDIEFQAATVISTTAGNLTLNPDGTLEVTPNANFAAGVDVTGNVTLYSAANPRITFADPDQGWEWGMSGNNMFLKDSTYTKYPITIEANMTATIFGTAANGWQFDDGPVSLTHTDNVLTIDFQHAKYAIQFARSDTVIGAIYKNTSGPLTYESFATASTLATHFFMGAVSMDTGLGVTGDITVTGTVDSVDVSGLPALIAANTSPAEVEAIIDAELVNGQSIDLAIDSLILTHKNITGAHHARYADSEVEDVITAEIVGGQSIDNAIDALVLTHKNLASAHHSKYTDGEVDTIVATHAAIDDAHHTKYTDTEVESVITAELVNGQSIDLAIDSLILTHKNIASAHHSKYTDAEALTQAQTRIQDTAYPTGWDTDTTHAPSQNAVYDKINSMDTLISANTTTTEVESIITAELVDGQSIDNAIDSLISTHASDNDIHHAKYTDTEVESVITAELVNGQSIDLAIDSLILTHKNIASAHHSRYADSEVESVITAEIIDGQSIDSAIDSLISTHTATGDAHHAKYTDTEVDTIVATHTAISDAHHSRYTDTEVESVITAEIVGGQSIDNAIDSLISTHASDNDIHHAKYTDTEVESVITAELAGGQSIDNAIDALVLTHKNLASAHHAKYTDSEVESVITAEIVGGQSIDNAIDSLILTHKNIAGAHHSKYTDASALAQAQTRIQDAAYGSGWNADTLHAPSQNAVYDKISSMDTLIAANTTVTEVEAVITAELVNGQSIDLAIDSLILTHKNITSAHHARYTDSEVEDVITAEIVGGESIDNAIDTLISTHAGLSDPHTGYILESLAGATNDFLIASGANQFVKRTLAQTGVILEGDMNHNNLQGVSAGQHFTESSISHVNITAGDGGDHSKVTANETAIGLRALIDAPTFTTSVTIPETAHGSDPDKFLCTVAGLIKYRTGAQVLSDIGAVSGSEYFELAGETTDAKMYNGADLLLYSNAGSTLKIALYGNSGSIEANDGKFDTVYTPNIAHLGSDITIQTTSSGNIIFQPIGHIRMSGFTYFWNSADAVFYSDAGSTEKLRIDGATGNISTVGTVDGVDVSDLPALISANTTPTEVEAIITAEIIGGQSIDNAIDALISTHVGLADPHTGYILESLAGAANDFLVASGANTFVKKTLAQTGVILEGDMRHNNLQGVASNEHFTESSISHANITAGDGSDHSKVTANETAIALRALIDAPTFTTSVTIPETAHGSDPDKFLCVVSGLIKYRTGAQVLSDIGAGAGDPVDILEVQVFM